MADPITPRIDLRNQTEIADTLRKLVALYCKDYWQDEEAVQADKWPEALIQIYGRFMEILIQHLNRVPDKNFLAFLDTMGVGLLPPRPAGCALTFGLAKGAPSYVKVPAGTQVAAGESPDDKPLIFETLEDLTVIRPKLVRAVSIAPSEDKWRNHSSVLFDDENPGRETLFTGSELVRHRIYFGHAKQFGFEEPKDVSLITDLEIIKRAGESPETLPRKFPFGSPGLPGKSPIFGKSRKLVKWFTYTEDSETPVELTVSAETEAEAVNLMAGGTITFENVGPIADHEIAGFQDPGGTAISKTGKWIFAELTVPVTDIDLPVLKSVNCLVEDTQAAKEYPPDLAFYNKYPVDLGKDFQPFGERPKLNDTFYLGSGEVLSKDGSMVKVHINLAAAGGSDGETVSLAWEYWQGERWEALTVEEDTTTDLTVISKDKPGYVAFKCPDIVPCKVNAEDNYWIRARITCGNYGKPVEYEKKNVTIGGATITVWSLKATESYKPPVIESLTLSQTPASAGKPVKTVVTCNNFIHQETTDISKGVQPFAPSLSDTVPALYLGFDSDIGELPVTAYFPVVTEVSAAPASAEDAQPPRLEWEYWNGSRWSPLAVEDDTDELTGRGMVSLLAGDDCSPVACFNEYLYWVRARLDEGEFPAEPQLAGIYLNSVQARNKVTITEELLGSGSGSPGQQLKFSKTAVLPDQEIFIREAELTAEEKARIEQEEGPGTFVEVKSSVSKSSEIWVRWHEVAHFWFSSPNSRHYTIDRQRGVITFGDGKRGMIPQAGRNNIKAAYRYGGGLRGNVASGTLIKMRKAFPYIGSVINPAPAEGGEDVETIPRVRTRGPRSIRHRNRAVTLTDYEWIVQEASTKIARVKGLSVTNPQKQFKPGWVTMMVVPQSNDAKPLPTAELIDEVQAYLAARAPSCLTTMVPLQQINLIPPNYLRVDVDVEVVVRSLGDAKEVENLVKERLDTFLHPLKGGPDGSGWEFGRDVYKTEIYQAIEAVAKVDYVSNVSLSTSEQIMAIEPEASIVTSSAFPDHSRVHFQERRMTFALAEELAKDEEHLSFVALGFMEGDHVQLRYKDPTGLVSTMKLYVTNTENGVLTCTPVKAEADFPAYQTIVETYLKPESLMVRSYLLANVERDSETKEIKVAMPLPGHDFVISHRDWWSNTLTGKIQAVGEEVETVYLEQDYLVYSGTHSVSVRGATAGEEERFKAAAVMGAATRKNVGRISIIPEIHYPYLVNIGTGEVHDLKNNRPECNIDRIRKDRVRFVGDLQDIKKELEAERYDYCGWCFTKGMSRR